MGLRLGQVKWDAGGWSRLSSLFQFLWEPTGSTRCVFCPAGKFWEAPLLSLLRFEQSHPWFGWTPAALCLPGLRVLQAGALSVV